MATHSVTVADSLEKLVLPNSQKGQRADPLFPELVPIARPDLSAGDQLVSRLRSLLDGGQLTSGETIAELEDQASRYLGVRECVAVSSCTSGLMLAERCLGLRGEVIVPSFTFFATAHSLLWNGLEPVLVDCDPETFQIDPRSVIGAITPQTSAILGVHIFGGAAPVEELARIARAFQLKLIYDAAHAFGSSLAGESLARWGDVSVYSLSPTKTLVAGEGGLVATDDRELASKLRRARNYGKSSGYDCDVLGLNARMTELQAAVATHSLQSIDAVITRRRQLAGLYRKILDGAPGIGLQQLLPGSQSTWKDLAVIVDSEAALSRDQLADELRRDNIETRAYFDPPLHRQRLYRRFHRPAMDPLTVSERVSREILCLPLHSGLSNGQVEAIANRVVGLLSPGEGRSYLIPATQPAMTPAPV